jgi:Crinkler effector protein N-terminal domain
MPKILQLNCLVSGDIPGHIFTIEIADNKNVSALKKAIKVEKPDTFKHVEADAIVLWGVSLPYDDSLQGIAAKFKQDFKGAEPLSPIDKLSKVFSNVDDSRLNIVVGPPPGAYK